jgi:hypothetical protein
VKALTQQPGGGRCGHQPLSSTGLGDIAALHHDVGTRRVEAVELGDLGA